MTSAELAALVIITNGTLHALPPGLSGCHFSPLDHQLYYVYSQMLYDESFEMSLADKPLSKTDQENAVSLGWSNVSSGASDVEPRWVNDSARAFNGNVSVELRRGSGAIANRGLYHQGFALNGARLYQGYLAMRSDAPASLRVAFEDWGDDPFGNGSTTAAKTTLAAQILHHPGGGDWIVSNFTLIPNASTTCMPYPFGKSPLDCSIPDSQESRPPSESGDCVVCGGTLTLALVGPGDAIDVDQVFVEPGEWGRFAGLHVRRAAVEWLLEMGTTLLRYGGTFTQTTQGLWKYDRGPAYLRPPCTAGKSEGGHGGCHLTKLARWTRGWGVVEVLQLCEAANLFCVLGFSSEETAESMGDFVDYAWGDIATTKYGALRAADGHPAPYPTDVAIEISNEACMASFVGTFAAKATAMEARAKGAGVGGTLRYVTGSYQGITTASAHCPESPNATLTVLREVKAAGLCSQLWIDTHVTPNVGGNVGMRQLASQLATILEREECPARLAILEENKCSSHFDRALDNAGVAAALEATPLIEAACTSQCWNAASHADGCGEGHINMLPNLTWGSPPFYAAQMVYRERPTVVLTSVVTPLPMGWDNLSVAAGRDVHGAVTLRLLNPNNVSVMVNITLDGGRAFLSNATLMTLTSPLWGSALYDVEHGGWNSPQRPTFIAPVVSTFTGTQMTLSPMSFVALRWPNAVESVQ